MGTPSPGIFAGHRLHENPGCTMYSYKVCSLFVTENLLVTGAEPGLKVTDVQNNKMQASRGVWGHAHLEICKAVVEFNSPVALMFTPLANLLPYGRIVSATGQFALNIKHPSNILSCNRCYRFRPLLTALICCICNSLKSPFLGF